MTWQEIALFAAFCIVALFIFVIALFVTFRLRRKHTEELSRHQRHLDAKHEKKRTTESLPKDSTWTEKIKAGFGVIGLSWIMGILFPVFFFAALFTNWLDLNPAHIYEGTKANPVAVTAIFILCAAAWYGFPKNNKVRFLGAFVGGTLLVAILLGWWGDEPSSLGACNSYSEKVQSCSIGTGWSRIILPQKTYRTEYHQFCYHVADGAEVTSRLVGDGIQYRSLHGTVTIWFWFAKGRTSEACEKMPT